MPNRDTSVALGSAANLARKHGREMFKSASEEDLRLLASYMEGIKQRARMVTNGELLPQQTGRSFNKAEIQEWQRERLQDLKFSMQQLAAVGEYYNEFLQIEAVKVRPDVYYPWLLEQLAPFWKKMQWEVGPGNHPSGQIIRLYRTLEDHIRNKLILADDYPEDFDVLGAGNLDGLLLEMYNQVVLNHDIKYNGTVWTEGMTFIHMAVAYMPEAVVRQIENKHKNTAFAKFIRDEHGRWNKEK